MKAGATMGLDEKTTVQMNGGENSGEKEKWQTKKAVWIASIVATVAVLTIVAVITGFVITSKQHSKSTRTIVEEMIKMPSGDEITNKREFVEEENIEIDTITRPDGTSQVVILDYNRKLQVIQGEQNCVVTPFNGTDADAVETAPHMYVVDSRPVKIKSFLAPSAQDMCDDKPVYWAHPRCLTVEEYPEAEQNRTKRDILIRNGTDYAGHHQITYSSTYCPRGIRGCCARCYEGFYNRNTQVLYGGSWYAIQSAGLYSILPFSLWFHQPNDISRVWCGWILWDNFVGNSPIYSCPPWSNPGAFRSVSGK